METPQYHPLHGTIESRCLITLTFVRPQHELSQTNPQVLTTAEGDDTKSIEMSVRVQRAKEDITVTWENLWVTVSSGKTKKPILQGLTGYASPGRILAIMGPSGCGKSTLLDSLAGDYTDTLYCLQFLH